MGPYCNRQAGKKTSNARHINREWQLTFKQRTNVNFAKLPSFETYSADFVYTNKGVGVGSHSTKALSASTTILNNWCANHESMALVDSLAE
eukprot:COSAG02_NODE_6282_length_3680_cov_3.448199_2_plen_91_part_00